MTEQQAERPTSTGIGSIEGVAVGDTFTDRRALADAGVHRALEAGIVGRQAIGAESIVLNKGYEDDEDYGHSVIYTGHGGKDSATGKQSKDQKWARGNRALQVSCDQGLPVRVVRGHREELGPSTGYRYDGLYFVKRYWEDIGKSGFKICRYELVRDDIGDPPWGTSGLPAPPSRRVGTIQRIVRSTAVTQAVKELHNHTCQICGKRMTVASGPYAEGAHIRALGRPHDGLDVRENVLCLCPTCHVYFDRGAIVLDDSLHVIDLTGSGLAGRQLRQASGHDVDMEAVRYHREAAPSNQERDAEEEERGGSAL